MKKALRPKNELERLRCLRSFDVLDTQMDEHCEQLTALISAICEVEIGLISFVDENRLWFKSHHGTDIPEVPRDISFCGHAILQDDVFIIEDTLLDERFKDNPFVLSSPKIRFYAGAPHRTSDNFNIGTFCVIDSRPQKLDKTQILALKSLADIIVDIFETRRKKNRINDQNKLLVEAEEESLKKLEVETDKIEQFFNVSIDLMCIAGRDGKFKKVNSMFTDILGYSEDELIEVPFMNFIHSEDLVNTERSFNKLMLGEKVSYFENRYRCKSGEYKLFSWSAAPDPLTGNFYASARDITNYRNNEFDLRQTLNLLNENTIVSRTDENGVITFANDKFCEISKYLREELVGKTHTLLSSGHHSREFFSQMWSAIKSGNIWRSKIKNKNKNGDFFWVDTTIAPFVAENGKSEFISIRYDITKEQNRQFLMDEISEIRARFIDYFTDQRKFTQYLVHKLMTLSESEFGFTWHYQE